MTGARSLILMLGLAGCATAAPPSRPLPPAPTGAVTPPVDTTTPESRRGTGDVVLLAPSMTARYQVLMNDTMAFAMPSGDSVVQYTAITAWLGQTSEPADNGFRLTFVLDSILASAQVPVPPALLDSARGTMWSVRVTANGHVDSLSVDRTNLLAGRVESLIRFLVPSLPIDGVATGAVWTDTTTAALGGPNSTVREVARMSWVASGPSVRGARMALVLTGQGTFTQQGSVTEFGQQRDLDTEGQRATTVYLGTDGVPAGFESAETSLVRVTVPSVGQTVEGRQRGTARAILLR